MEWCGPVLSRLERTPVLWSFPAITRGGGSTLLDELKRRLASGRDLIVSMGFRGAIHPVLSLDEIEKELSWAVSNPWSTGLKDLFGLEGKVLAPQVPDFRRPRAAEAYSKAGFSRICVRWPDGRGPCKRAGITLIPFIHLLPKPGTPAELSKSIARAVGRNAEPFIIVDLSRAVSSDCITGYLEALLAFMRSAGFEIAPPETLFSRKGQDFPGALPEVWPEVPTQTLRENMAAVSYLQRKKKKKNEDYRKILDHLSYRGIWDSSTEKYAHEEKTREKTLVAHMQGDVMLAGSDFDVRLSGGRFYGLVKQGRPITPGIPASSYMTIKGKTYHFKSRSAISFEGDAGTGLRDDLMLDPAFPQGANGGRLGIEYEFRGDVPELFISVSLKYPDFQDQTVDDLAPLVLSLAELEPGASGEIAVTYPDGSSAHYAIMESDGWKAVPGLSWHIRTSAGGIALHASPVSERKWGLCFFRVVKKRGRRQLEVNPFGTPRPFPGTLVGGKTETHSVLIGLAKTRSKGGA